MRTWFNLAADVNIGQGLRRDHVDVPGGSDCSEV